MSVVFFHNVVFSSRRRHTRCALVTGVQTCALPIYGKSKRQAARGSPGHAKRGLCTERRLQRACDSRMHCKAVSSFGREIIGKSRSNLARAQLPGVGETRIAMLRTIEKQDRPRLAIYRSALAHGTRPGRQITIPRGAVEKTG